TILSIMRFVVFFTLIFLTACASNIERVPQGELASIPEPKLLDEQYFGNETKIETLEDVFSLTRTQQQDFLAYFNHYKNKSLYPNKRISRYLSGRLESFNFYSDTLTADDALERKLGNCLSLAIVTHSLANLVNVDVGYELVETPAVYQKEGGIVLSSQHVRTLLHDPKRSEFTNGPLWRGYIRVDYYPAEGTKTLRRVSSEEFFAMFYRNRAAEALTRNEHGLAYAYAKEALKYNKLDEQAINMLAVLHDNLGFKNLAENLFEYGLKYGRSDEKFELLYNYHLHLIQNEKNDKAQRVAKQLRRYDDPNPYKWVNLGNEAIEDERYHNAISYFRKASKMADYLHEPYAGMANAYYLMGKYERARKAMKKALEKTHKQEKASIYQVKYNKLVELANNDS
ncbi:MAG: tetratricopeptide repeat protein, partial [Kangiellaceae bacterium]|nr:tetratricopeptide repeat protein [Kangiellaceae bacterium]